MRKYKLEDTYFTIRTLKQEGLSDINTCQSNLGKLVPTRRSPQALASLSPFNPSLLFTIRYAYSSDIAYLAAICDAQAPR